MRMLCHSKPSVEGEEKEDKGRHWTFYISCLLKVEEDLLFLMYDD